MHKNSRKKVMTKDLRIPSKRKKKTIAWTWNLIRIFFGKNMQRMLPCIKHSWRIDENEDRIGVGITDGNWFIKKRSVKKQRKTLPCPVVGNKNVLHNVTMCMQTLCFKACTVGDQKCPRLLNALKIFFLIPRLLKVLKNGFKNPV